MTTDYWLYSLDLLGVGVFAISGALAARKAGMDIFGMLVLAAVAGVGGGTLRDVLLGAQPVFWVQDGTYLWVIIGCAIATAWWPLSSQRSQQLLTLADACGIALFTVLGFERALTFGVNDGIAILMGMCSAVAGGMIRDLLAGQIPLILHKEVYATASLAGGILYMVLHTTIAPGWAMLLSSGLTLVIRLAALKWRLQLPVIGHH